jgi:hypothetical protein
MNGLLAMANGFCHVESVDPYANSNRESVYRYANSYRRSFYCVMGPMGEVAKNVYVTNMKTES